MKWFQFTKRKHSPTKINISKSERSSRKSSGSRSARGDSSSGHASRRRRRHSHSTSLPRDIQYRSYYAPTQRNFYPPNVVRPQPPVVVNSYGGYFQGTQPRAAVDFAMDANQLIDERGYAEQLYRNQFLFFRPKKSQTLKPNYAPFRANGYAAGLMGNSVGVQQFDPHGVNENNYRHSAPVITAKYFSPQVANPWNWGFQSSPSSYSGSSTLKRVSRGIALRNY